MKNTKVFCIVPRGAVFPFILGCIVMLLFIKLTNKPTDDTKSHFVPSTYAYAADDHQSEPVMPDPTPLPLPDIERATPLMELVEVLDWGGFEWKAQIATPYIDCGLSEDVQDYLYIMCLDLGIDYALALGWIQQESVFNPNEVSSTNDWGLTQINVCNHKWLQDELGITDFLEPKCTKTYRLSLS